MGYSSSGGTKGRGTFTSTATTQADFNKMLSLLAEYGNIQVLTTSERDALSGTKLYSGMVVSNTTTGRLERYSGSGWDIVWSPQAAYTPTLTGLTAGSGTVVGSYSVSSGWVDFSVDITLGSGFSATAAFYVSLPLTASTSYQHVGTFVALGPSSARQTGVVGLDTSARVWMLRTDNNFLSNTTYTWATGNRISLQGRYKAA